MKCKCCESTLKIYNKLKSPNVYICDNCSHIYRDYSNINLTEFYQKYREKFKLYDDNKREIFSKNLINIINPYISVDKSLEIGSADGFLADKIKEHSNNVICSELDNNFKEILEKKKYKVYEDFMKIDDNFDSIIMVDVLEHINDLDSCINKLSSICKKYIIIQVPFKRSIHNKKEFDGHFHYFSKNSIKSLFNKYKLKDIFYKETNGIKTDKNATANGCEIIAVFEKNE